MVGMLPGETSNALTMGDDCQGVLLSTGLPAGGGCADYNCVPAAPLVVAQRAFEQGAHWRSAHHHVLVYVMMVRSAVSPASRTPRARVLVSSRHHPSFPISYNANFQK